MNRTLGLGMCSALNWSKKFLGCVDCVGQSLYGSGVELAEPQHQASLIFIKSLTK